MKLYKCTVETYPNNCYVETLLIVADDKQDALQQIKDSRRDKYNEDPRIVFTQNLEELKIDTNKKGILNVGHGHGDSDNGWDD